MAQVTSLPDLLALAFSFRSFHDKIGTLLCHFGGMSTLGGGLSCGFGERSPLEARVVGFPLLME